MEQQVLGFQESQNLKKKQKVLEISKWFIANGYEPTPGEVSFRAAISPSTCKKLQVELQAEGLLVIPEGLSPIPVKRFSNKRNDPPRDKSSKPEEPPPDDAEPLAETVKTVTGPKCTRFPDKPSENHQWRHTPINPEKAASRLSIEDEKDGDAREQRIAMIKHAYQRRLTKRRN